ncbi:LEA type 2 family protein [Colwellia sp. RE-S-Sl-9]
MRTWSMFFALFCILLTSCASISPIKTPEVSLLSIEPSKTKGFSQYFTLKLLVTNPNSFDLAIDDVMFNLTVADKKVMTGSSSSVPLLKANSETAVALSANVGLFDLLKLLAYFSEHHQQEIRYNLATTIDPSGFIPLTVNREGVLSDELLSGIKRAKKR